MWKIIYLFVMYQYHIKEGAIVSHISKGGWGVEIDPLSEGDADVQNA